MGCQDIATAGERGRQISWASLTRETGPGDGLRLPAGDSARRINSPESWLSRRRTSGGGGRTAARSPSRSSGSQAPPVLPRTAARRHPSGSLARRCRTSSPTVVCLARAPAPRRIRQCPNHGGRHRHIAARTQVSHAWAPFVSCHRSDQRNRTHCWLPGTERDAGSNPRSLRFDDDVGIRAVWSVIPLPPLECLRAPAIWSADSATPPPAAAAARAPGADFGAHAAPFNLPLRHPRLHAHRRLRQGKTSRLQECGRS